MLTSSLVDITNLELAAATIFNIRKIERQKNAYFYSYFPRTIREWNALAVAIVEADSLVRFQLGLRDYLVSD